MSRPSRLSGGGRSTQKRSTGRHTRCPRRVLLSAAITCTVLLFGDVVVAASSAHAAGEVDRLLDDNPTTLLTGHTASNSSNYYNGNRSGEECNENPLLGRSVDATDYEYGCKEIEVNEPRIMWRQFEADGYRNSEWTL